jgi:hypothetical protein
MTRIITDGAEMGDALFWDSQGPSGVYAQNSGPTPYASAYYYKFRDYGYKNLPSSLTEIYVRARCSFSLNAATYQRFPGIRHGGTELAYLTLNGSWQPIAVVNGVTVGTGTATVSSTWTLFETYFKLADAGRFIVKRDGNIIIDYSGDTLVTANVHFDNLIFGHTTNYEIYIDDIAVNNTDGANDNSWCGDGIILKLTPSGSGTTNNWLNSGSVSGSANYLYVDEYPYDSDTTYVYCSGSNIGFQDQYKTSTVSVTGKVITRVFPEARIKKTAAMSAAVKLGYLPLSGTDQLSGSSALTLSYARYIGSEAITNPVTSASWTESDINGLEYVIEAA